MRWIDRLERHIGRWSIPEFPLFIVVANGAIYLLSQVQPAFLSQLLLDPDAVRAGQWWRIVTFLFVPPFAGSLILLVFWLYLLYTYAHALEQEWGEFQFCFFYLIGAAATAIAALFIARDTISNVPLNTTLFLAFATLFPNVELLLFFVLPVKVKYIAWVLWGMSGVSLVMGSFVTRVAIAASLLNYLLFFGPELLEALKLRVQVARNRRRFRSPPTS
ncbi:MAG: rhomboid family intramembrane serine protease [Elusimicrobiota bacterium]|jgi:membrane associated rhomboid family serine protease